MSTIMNHNCTKHNNNNMTFPHEVVYDVNDGQQPVIGIKNSSGTACHISSSIIILYYCLRPIMDVIQLWYTNVIVNDYNNINDSKNSCIQYKFIHNLIQFMKEIQYCQNNQKVDNNNERSIAAVVNPMDFYLNIKETLNIEVNDFGDAITTFNKILYHITKTFDATNRSNNMEVDPPFVSLLSNEIKSFIDTILYSGTTQSILCGTKMIETTILTTDGNITSNDNKQYRIMKRIKKLKIQSLCNPIVLPIPAVDVESTSIIPLIDIIQHILYDHRIIDGEYNWNDGKNVTEQSYDWNDDNISQQKDNSIIDIWNTTKCMGVIQYPPILMFHLQRFHMISTTSTGGCQLKPIQTSIEIPLSIYLPVPEIDMIVNDELEFTTTTQEYPSKIKTYELIGGIIHVTDDDNDNKEEDTTTWYDESAENEYGHYVSVIRREVIVEDNSNTHHYQWFLINDEHVMMIRECTMLQLLGGKKVETIHDIDIDNNNNKTNNETTIDVGTYRGILLVYQQIDYIQTTIQPLLETIQEQIRHHVVQPINQYNNDDNINNQIDDNTQTIFINHDENNLIGRRLEIKWAKGKYYPGIIISYNTTTGKHCIKYDDDDIKHYHLHKKTIRWIDYETNN